VATDRFSWVVIGLALFAAGSVAAYYIFATSRSVETWLDPFADPDGAGYQMVQSLFSFATGGIFGTGLGNGQPGTVPAASTDFIIAAIGEELGLVGLAAVLMLYTIVIIRGTAHRDRGAGQLRQAAGRRAGVDAGDPVVHRGGRRHQADPADGLTTPWMSYGGSSLLANYVLLAIWCASRTPPAADRHQAARPADRRLEHRGDPAGMNTSLRRIRVMIMVPDRAAARQRHLTQVFTADGLRADPRNSACCSTSTRGSAADLRGRSAAGVLGVHRRPLPVPARLPEPLTYRPVTGLLLAAYSSTGLERRRGHHPQRLRRAVVRPRLADFFTGRDPRGGNVRPPSIPGCSRRLGTRCRRLHGPCTGAVVRLEPSTGKVLAMVSLPRTTRTCLPATMFNEQSPTWQHLRDNPDSPLLNRAISETYPPGSTFKVITTAARLQAGATGHASCRRAANSAAGQHRNAGELRRLRLRRRPDRLAARRVREIVQHRLRPARHQHRRRRTEVHRDGVRTRRHPAPIPLQVAESTVGPITDGAALGMSSIGQKDVALTPLQNALVAATIANKGVTMQPYLVDSLKGPDLANISTTAPREQRRAVSRQVANTLTDLMVDAEQVTQQKGAIAGVQIASKTGTAEHGTDPRNTPASRVVHRVRACIAPQGRGRGARGERR
jgi:peptidoglycan glycosyltransferase